MSVVDDRRSGSDTTDKSGVVAAIPPRLLGPRYEAVTGVVTMPTRDSVTNHHMSAASSRLDLHLLGPPEVVVDGAPLVVDTRKAVALLAHLAVSRSGPTRDQIASLLWPDADPERARSALRRTLSSLRSALGGRWVVADRDRLWLDRTGMTFDVDQVEVLLSGTRQSPGGPSPSAIESLATAEALHRGRFLSGFFLRDAPEFEAWTTEVAEECGRRHRQVLALLVDALVAYGRFGEAAAVARRWIELDPLDESAHRSVMLSLAWDGDRSGSVDAYRALVRVLDEELGVPPLEETTELYEAILDEDLPRPPGGRPTPLARRPEPDRPELTGRGQELGAILEVVRRRAGATVTLTGEPGVGKTRLLDEVLEVLDPDTPVLAARGAPGQRALPFGVVASLLRASTGTGAGVDRWEAVPDWAMVEAARLLPDLAKLRPGVEAPSPLDHPSTELRLSEGLLQALTTTAAGGLVVVDDLHHADPASIGFLALLVHRIRDLDVVLLLSYRDDELPAGSPLLEAMADGRSIDLRLGPLTGDDARRLHRLATGRDEPAGTLLRRTGGIPLYLIEDLDHASGRARETILARLARLSELGRQVLAAAAVASGPADERWLRSVSGRSDDETVSGIEELLASRVLSETGADGFELAHEMLRDAAYEHLSLVRRRLLHRRAAEAMGVGSDPRRVAAAARHLRLAGLDADAAELSARAGDLSMAVSAREEAEEHYRTALALGHPDRAGLHRSLGDLALLSGDLTTARTEYETAAAGSAGADLAVLEHRIGELARRLGAWDTAEGHYRRAEPDHPSPTSLYADWALLEHRRGDRGAALARAEAAVAAASTDLERSRALDILGVLTEDPGSACQILTESLDLAADDPVLRMAALNNLGLALERAGDRDAAMAPALEALDLAAKVGDRHREAALHNRVADLLHAAGDEEGSREALHRAVSRFAAVGADPATWEPEVWLLTQW
jgi:DNA-binding SARP family transcriptional activator/tetratricopeptide (TPR) repeat protein